MDVAFLPVQVFMTVIVLNRITAMREKTARRQKLNMIVGVFYSEIGSRLLREISRADTALDSIRPRLLESGRETLSLELFQNYKPAIDPARLPLQELKKLLHARRDFLSGLLENQAVMEHERFTELLWGVFHFCEELDYRTDLESLPANDREHLRLDAVRAYKLLGTEWLSCLAHLRAHYPYLHSLAVRTSPFRATDNPVIN